MFSRRTRVIVSLIAVVAVAVMIFMFSAQEGEKSSRVSGRVTKFLLNVFVRGFRDLPPTERAAYMARYIAKNVVAAGLSDSCEVQLSYAIGVSDPVSVLVDLGATGRADPERVSDAVREIFPLTPSGIIKGLRLNRPIFERTSFGGHFGRSADGAYSWEQNLGVASDDYFTWEQTDKASELAQLLR